MCRCEYVCVCVWGWGWERKRTMSKRMNDKILHFLLLLILSIRANWMELGMTFVSLRIDTKHTWYVFKSGVRVNCTILERKWVDDEEGAIEGSSWGLVQFQNFDAKWIFYELWVFSRLSMIFWWNFRLKKLILLLMPMCLAKWSLNTSLLTDLLWKLRVYVLMTFKLWYLFMSSVDLLWIIKNFSCLQDKCCLN